MADYFPYATPYGLSWDDYPTLTLVPNKLTGAEDFESWRVSMLAALGEKNKVGFVDGSLPQPPEDRSDKRRVWSFCDQVVRSWLFNSISKGIGQHVLYVESAQEIWDKLCFRFGQNNNSPCCLSLESDKASQLFFNIFGGEEYSKHRVIHELSSDSNLREKVMEILISSFHCQTHHAVIKKKICLAVWMIGEYTFSFKEIDDGYLAIKKSIGELPFFPESVPNGVSCYEECRHRLLVQEDVEFRRLIARVVINLYDRIKQHLVKDIAVVKRNENGEPNQLGEVERWECRDKACDGKLTVRSTETALLLLCLTKLPKGPVCFGTPNVEEELWKLFRSMCNREDGIRKVLISSGGVNLVNLLTTKLKEDDAVEKKWRIRWQHDYWEAHRIGDINPPYFSERIGNHRTFRPPTYRTQRPDYP